MRFDEDTSIKEIRDKIQEFINERDWEKFHNPKDLAMSIAIESAELMEIFQWKDKDFIDNLKKNLKSYNSVEEELADIIIYVFSLANTLGIDVSEVVFKKIESNAEKYPVEKAFGKADKYTELE